jgi:hypothetical protein
MIKKIISSLGIFTLLACAGVVFAVQQGQGGNERVENNLEVVGSITSDSGLGQMPDPSNVVYVAKTGGQYSTIQGAIDSITDAASDNWYIVKIAPGVYTENVVGKNYVTLLGDAASSSDLVIQATSGTVYTAPNTASSISNINLKLLPTASGGKLYDATAGGNHEIYLVFGTVESSTNGITSQLIDVDCTDFSLLRSTFEYTMTGSAVGNNTHQLIKYGGSTDYLMSSVALTATVGDVDDDVHMFVNDTTGTSLFTVGAMLGISTNASYSGDFVAFRGESDTGLKKYSNIDTTLAGAGSGDGFIFDLDSDTNNLEAESIANPVVVSGFANNYFARVATGDTLDSQADLIIAADNTIGVGTVNFVDSQEYGQIEITGGTEFTIDVTDEWHAFSIMTTGLSSDYVTVAQGSTGAITDTANNGGVLRVTDVGHGLSTGDYVTLTGMGDAAHNGITGVTVINSDTFDADDITYNSDDDTGTWNQGSYIQPARRGAYRIDYAFSASSVGANKNFDFAAFDGVTQVAGTKIRRKFATAGDVGAFAGTGIVFLEKDAVLWFGIYNDTDATNITISEGAFNISKES